MMDKPHLRLVSAFSHESYPWRMHRKLQDPLDISERQRATEIFRHAASVAGIGDYKIFEEHAVVTFSLRTTRDFLNATVGMQPGNMAVLLAEYNAPHRIVKKRCAHASKVMNEILPGKISFMIDTESQIAVIRATDKASYFKAEKMRPLEYITGKTL